MQHLLLEETIYDDILEAQDEKKVVKKKVINKQERKKRRHEKAKVNMGNYSFGLIQAIGIFSLLILGIVSLNYTLILFLESSSNRINNLVSLYILGIEAWQSLASVHSFFLETVIWNDTVPVWGEDSTLGTYQFFVDHINEQVIPNYTRALEYDLGNFTTEFNYALTKVNNISVIIFKGKFL